MKIVKSIMQEEREGKYINFDEPEIDNGAITRFAASAFVSRCVSSQLLALKEVDHRSGKPFLDLGGKDVDKMKRTFFRALRNAIVPWKQARKISAADGIRARRLMMRRRSWPASLWEPDNTAVLVEPTLCKTTTSFHLSAFLFSTIDLKFRNHTAFLMAPLRYPCQRITVGITALRES